MIETHVERFVRNCWYVAGWEDEVPAEGLFERTLLGESVLFFRTADGGTVAMENRCLVVAVSQDGPITVFGWAIQDRKVLGFGRLDRCLVPSL